MILLLIKVLFIFVNDHAKVINKKTIVSCEKYSVVEKYFCRDFAWSNRWWFCLMEIRHCVKSVRIRSYDGPYSPSFGLSTEIYGVSLNIQTKCRKTQTRITPNTDTLHAVHLKRFVIEMLMDSINSAIPGFSMVTRLFNGNEAENWH